MSKRYLRSSGSRSKSGPVETRVVDGAPSMKGTARNRKNVHAARLREMSLSGALTVPATIDGECPQCHCRIMACTDLIVRRGGRWIHSRCEQSAKKSRVDLLYAWEITSP